jgi:hypothetical protein
MQVAKIMSTPVARAIRGIIGLVLIYIGYANMDGTSAIVVMVLGLAFLLSGLLNFCAIAKIAGGPFFGKDAK